MEKKITACRFEKNTENYHEKKNASPRTNLTNMLNNYRLELDKIFNIHYKAKDTSNGHYSTCYHGKRLITVTIIHNGEHICFNCIHREILYAVQFCVKDYCGHDASNYRESLYGKALNYKHEHLPESPPFENIMYHYQELYFIRLSLIDRHFESLDAHAKKHIPLEDLKKKKEGVWNYPSFNILYLPLPQDIIKEILEFLKYVNIEKTLLLRKQYENIRANLNTLSILDK